jgi:hypothetical protein
MPSFLKCSVFSAAVALLLPVGWSGAQETQRFPIDEADGSYAEVEHVFSAVPPGGYTALRITIDNKSKQERKWSLTTNSTTPADRSEHALATGVVAGVVKPESRIIQEVSVPLMTDFSLGSGYQDRRLVPSLTVSGRVYTASFGTSGMATLPFSALSVSLGGKDGEVLAAGARKSATTSSGYSSDETCFASFLPVGLPADWHAYLGLDILALSADEWNTLQPGVRTAIRQWMILGGVLDLYHTGAAPEGVLRELGVESRDKRHALGAGGVRTFEWDGKELPEQSWQRFAKANSAALLDINSRQETANESLMAPSTKVDNPGLRDALGIRSFAAWQVGLILLLFGIVVGPVNLFYLAGPGRRHRIFLTTPVIALAASAVLIAVIFLQDGAGGSGQRAALVELRPDENNLYIRQYQISRTGVLFGGGYTLEDAAAVTPLMLDSSRWTRLKAGRGGDVEGQRYTVPEPKSYAGDWFQSRSEQAQLVESIRPGRGRLELKPGAVTPEIVSSLPGTVRTLYYQDLAKQWWVSRGPLATGGTAVLEQADEVAFLTWLETVMKMFPVSDRFRMKAAAGAGRFVAVSDDAKTGLVETLKSIAWTNDLTVLHGRLASAP